MQNDTLFILAVALITWGGVFGYMLRLNALAKSVEEIARRHDKHE